MIDNLIRLGDTPDEAIHSTLFHRYASVIAAGLTTKILHHMALSVLPRCLIDCHEEIIILLVAES